MNRWTATGSRNLPLVTTCSRTNRFRIRRNSGSLCPRKLLGDGVHFFERNRLAEGAEVVQLIFHFSDRLKIHGLNGYFSFSHE